MVRTINRFFEDYAAAYETGDSDQCDDGDHFRFEADGDRIPADKRRTEQQHAVCSELSVSTGVFIL